MLHGVLDGQFGFSGFVMSDWGANHSTVASANAGMDMEMPGGVSNDPEYYGSGAADRGRRTGRSRWRR